MDDQLNRIKNLFTEKPKDWINCTHRDLVKLANVYDLRVNEVVEIYYKTFKH